MSTNLQSETISAIGIFGILEPKQENYFQKLQAQYSHFEGHEEENTFNHLSIVINKNEPLKTLETYKELLLHLKERVPYRIVVEDVIVIDNNHIALAFNSEACSELRGIAKSLFSKGIIETYYMKVVRYVRQEDRNKVIEELKSIEKLIITDFVLITEKLDRKHIITSSSQL